MIVQILRGEVGRLNRRKYKVLPSPPHRLLSLGNLRERRSDKVKTQALNLSLRTVVVRLDKYLNLPLFSPTTSLRHSLTLAQLSCHHISKNVVSRQRLQDHSGMAQCLGRGPPSIAELPQDVHHLYHWAQDQLRGDD